MCIATSEYFCRSYELVLTRLASESTVESPQETVFANEIGVVIWKIG
jgi:hypothetical protein